ncbi:putative Cut9 interacting protein Scn1 [Lepidopterella palustris CBS 459.81]|uniref:Putative Cut9 interacting protein Scn1 n=1 Tax=Lepidopterella palustris CBS 459.81 TaxID=1314670 RepID=A0A8E2JJC1_9PEZI|nr:putative Cut9 interacting protein Scn1 [Lepidopterella palustris CBS 459.81]
MAECEENRDADGEAFPWHLGVYDAHCHPTDTMASIPSLPDMKARILTVMATRAQDQELVAQTADTYGIRSGSVDSTPDVWSGEERMVPCFGWHPWFSHQMFDDSDYDGQASLDAETKILHYQTVLAPRRERLSDEEREVFASLPDPRPFSQFLDQTRRYLEKYPFALVGEIGLDRSFRIREAWIPEHEHHRDGSLTPGGREGRKLSPYRVHIQHQKKLFKAQLHLAGEMQRAVSVHGVQAHGIVFETIQETWKGHERKVLSKRERKRQTETLLSNANVGNEDRQEGIRSPKPFPPRICLHSYSGNPDAFKQYLNPAIPAEIFASFSTAINLSEKQDSGAPSALEDLIRLVPDDRLLVESDLHIAGPRMDEHLEDMVRRLCRIKGWGLSEGIERLGENWKMFVFGAKR